MNGNFGQGAFSSTLIETDLDGNLVNNEEMPFWLRDIVQRAFSASGIRNNRKVASKDAIASLQEVDSAEVTEDSCPICYDSYVLDKNKKKKRNPEDMGEEMGDDQQPQGNRFDQIVQNMAKHGVNVPTQQESAMFSDPALFVPVDATANYHLRFPPANLYTGNTVTNADMFPSLKRDTPVATDSSDCEHTPVSMPNCGHVFGKPCIIEWLNGHVSCPLCRKEVEALSETDPVSKKIATIKKNCNFVFSQDPSAVISHIANNLTDVFNPYRKPMNPSITPLTDTSVPQAWARPLYPENGVAPSLKNSTDPALIMTRKFPLSNFGRDPPEFPIVSMLSLSLNQPLQPTNTLTNTPPNNTNSTRGRNSQTQDSALSSRLLSM